jgi:hypothetical protein
VTDTTRTLDGENFVHRLLNANPDLTDRIDMVTHRRGRRRCAIHLVSVDASLRDLAEWVVRYGAVIVGGIANDFGTGAPRHAWKATFEYDQHLVEVFLQLPIASVDGILFAGDCG